MGIGLFQLCCSAHIVFPSAEWREYIACTRRLQSSTSDAQQGTPARSAARHSENRQAICKRIEDCFTARLRFWSDVTPFEFGAPATARSFLASAKGATAAKKFVHN